MKTNNVFCLAVMLFICIVVNSQSLAKEVKYNRTAAINYAAKYNGDPSPYSDDNGYYFSHYKCWNGSLPECENHPRKRGNGKKTDCANFASQALIAGGIDFNIYGDKGPFYVTPYAATPVIISKSGRTIGFPAVSDLNAVLWRSYCFEFITDPVIMKAKAKAGDILSKTRYSHVMIYAGDEKYYAHTTDRDGAKVSWTGPEEPVKSIV